MNTTTHETSARPADPGAFLRHAIKLAQRIDPLDDTQTSELRYTLTKLAEALAAAQAPAEPVDLHAQIMNLPVRDEALPAEINTRLAYKRGHRDARHAAAELVAAAGDSACYPLAENPETAPQTPGSTQPARCTSCDDTGDVTDLTGEWRGYCTCEAGQQLKARTPAEQPPVDNAYVAPGCELFSVASDTKEAP